MRGNNGKRIKPKVAIHRVEAKYSGPDKVAGDRIAEKLSISVPVQPLLRPTGLGAFFSKRVRLLLKDGSIVTGFLQKRLFDFLHLLNIVEIGASYKLTADWCAIDIDSVSRIYPANAQVEQISKS